jgi:hypothetical protein
MMMKGWTMLKQERRSFKAREKEASVFAYCNTKNCYLSLFLKNNILLF